MKYMFYFVLVVAFGYWSLEQTDLLWAFIQTLFFGLVLGYALIRSERYG